MFPSFLELNPKWKWMTVPSVDADMAWLCGLMCCFFSNSNFPVSKRIFFSGCEKNSNLTILRIIKCIKDFDKGLETRINFFDSEYQCVLRSRPLRQYFETYFSSMESLKYFETKTLQEDFLQGFADAFKVSSLKECL